MGSILFDTCRHRIHSKDKECHSDRGSAWKSSAQLSVIRSIHGNFLLSASSTSNTSPRKGSEVEARYNNCPYCAHRSLRVDPPILIRYDPNPCGSRPLTVKDQEKTYMFRRQVIISPISKQEAVQILNRHIQRRFIRDAVQEDSFQLHTRVARTDNRAFLTFYIKGTLTEDEHGLRVSYTIRPTYLAVLLSAALFATLLEGLLKLCVGTGNMPYALIGLTLNLIFQGSIAWQERVCLQHLNRWLAS